MTFENRFDSDLIKIKQFLLKFQPVAIILHGGYGRGEGSWIVENGEHRPYNDYDIFLIIEKKIPENELNDIRKCLAKEIGIKWVDIMQLHPDELSSLRLSIKNFDLKYASKVIYGDENILELIPEMDATQMPLVEGEILFFTRLWTLLGCLGLKGVNQVLRGEASRFFRNQMAKSVLAVVDVMLLLKGGYHPSYRERVRRVIELYPERDSIHELAKWALDEKLWPKVIEMSDEEVIGLYSQVQSLFFKKMFNILSAYYNQKIKTAYDVERHYCYSLVNIAKRIASIIVRRNLKRERKVAVNMAQMFVAATYRNGNVNPPLLARGLNYMKKLDNSISNNLSWDEARIKVAQLRMEV